MTNHPLPQKIDDSFPVTIWSHLTKDNVKIARIVGSTIYFNFGLETYCQWCKKLKQLGLPLSAHDFHPSNAAGTKMYEAALPEIIDCIETPAEAEFIWHVVQEGPAIKDPQAVFGCWRKMQRRVCGSTPNLDEVFAQKRQAVAA